MLVELSCAGYLGDTVMNKADMVPTLIFFGVASEY